MKGGYILIDLSKYVVDRNDEINGGNLVVNNAIEDPAIIKHIHDCVSLGKQIITKVAYNVGSAIVYLEIPCTKYITAENVRAYGGIALDTNGYKYKYMSIVQRLRREYISRRKYERIFIY